MKTFLALIIGIAIGAGIIWYLQKNPQNRNLRQAGADIESTARSAGNSIKEEVQSWDLSTDKVKEEMSRTGKVIRQKTAKAGEAIADATADARVTGVIKAKLVRDPDLSAWNISVNTTAGKVTLAGSVSAPDFVSKAMVLAMETDGVREVVSTLQVNPNPPERK